MRLAGELLREDILAAGNGDHAPPHQGLHRLGPHAFIAAEADMAVDLFLAEGNLEGEAQALDEIPVPVAIEHERVDDADAVEAGVEVKSHREGQPGAAGFGRVMDALDPDHGADRAGLLQRGGTHQAGELLQL